MTLPRLPFSLRTQQTIAAFYRAGYPVEEIADATGVTAAACRQAMAEMRRAGWLLRRPRGPHEPVQVDTAGCAPTTCADAPRRAPAANGSASPRSRTWRAS